MMYFPTNGCCVCGVEMHLRVGAFIPCCVVAAMSRRTSTETQAILSRIPYSFRNTGGYGKGPYMQSDLFDIMRHHNRGRVPLRSYSLHARVLPRPISALVRNQRLTNPHRSPVQPLATQVFFQSNRQLPALNSVWGRYVSIMSQIFISEQTNALDAVYAVYAGLSWMACYLLTWTHGKSCQDCKSFDTKPSEILFGLHTL
jgi:hypothetical protein